MLRSNRLGILQRCNYAAMNARDWHDYRVFYRVKLSKSFGGELFRNENIVFVNGAKHEHEKRDNYHHYPGAMYELGGNEDAEHNERSGGPYGINCNGFLPVCAVCNFVRDEGRFALVRRLQFCVR